MATFTGTAFIDTAHAGTGVLVGFTGGTVAELQDTIGDLFIGGPSRDEIIAASGDDTIKVSQGEVGDNIDGGLGTDFLDLSGLTSNANVNLTTGIWSISPTAGNTTVANVENVIGGRGADTLIGNCLANRLIGLEGDDTLSGGAGDDSIFGGLKDSIDGGDGNDELFGFRGEDTIKGGNGNDLVRAGEQRDTVDGGDGDDTIEGGFANDVIIGGNSNDLIFGMTQLSPDGSNDADLLNGDDGNDTIRGSAGNDTVDGGSGNDSINGGAGNNVLQGGLGSDTIIGGNGSNQIFAMSLANPDGSGDGDLLIGGIGSALIRGSSGDDTIAGRGRLIGAGGVDSIDGSAEGDWLEGGLGIDTVNGHEGNDRIVLLEGDVIDVIDGGLDLDTLDLSGITTHGAIIDLTDGTWVLSGSLGSPSTLASIELVVGTQTGDSINGGEASTDDRLSGLGGNDTLRGGDGSDTISGGSGNDSIQGGLSRDSINAAGGNDTIRILEGEAIDNIDGGTGSDILVLVTISTMAAKIDLALGTWSLSASSYGSASIIGIEQVIGTLSNDTIIGSAANEALGGGGGNDTISGGLGRDTLTGGSGGDRLTGGESADIFDFNSIAAAPVIGTDRDTITDFDEFVTDKIDLSDIIAGSFTFIGSAAFTGVNQVRAFQLGGNTFVDLNTTGSGGTDARIKLIGLHTLDASDFIL